MIAYGFARSDLRVELDLARRLGATTLEILPEWRVLPDPKALRAITSDAGFAIHSAHGCWGGQSIRAARVDLGALDAATRSSSVLEIKACAEWLDAAGGTCLVVHPGGLSNPDDAPARGEALTSSLNELGDFVRGTSVVLCVENMPPGVHPGSRMADLASLVGTLNRPEVALALDTGHAHIASTPQLETHAAGRLLRTTHVHDNDGRQDSHLPPGLGTLDWSAWRDSLDAINYEEPIMLECIRYLRQHPESITPAFLELLARLTGDLVNPGNL